MGFNSYIPDLERLTNTQPVLHAVASFITVEMEALIKRRRGAPKPATLTTFLKFKELLRELQLII